MPSENSQRQVNSKLIDSAEENKTTSKTAKVVLFVFGVGPLLLMGLFLFLNGFFSSPL